MKWCDASLQRHEILYFLLTSQKIIFVIIIKRKKRNTRTCTSLTFVTHSCLITFSPLHTCTRPKLVPHHTRTSILYLRHTRTQATLTPVTHSYPRHICTSLYYYLLTLVPHHSRTRVKRGPEAQSVRKQNVQDL